MFTSLEETTHRQNYFNLQMRTTSMTLQSEIDERKKEISTDAYSMSIGELISLYKEEELDIHPEFQRFFRWKAPQKSKLIESILLGIPLPSIFVSQREDGVWDVIDGVQRLSTIFEFVGILKDDNNQPKPASILEKTYYLPALEGKMWENNEDIENSFTSTQRLQFKREKIDVKIVKKESDKTIKYELFQRLNTLGTKLSDQEVRNCLLIMLNKDTYSWLEYLSKFEPFLNTLSLAERLSEEKYEMELALRFIVLINNDPSEIRKFGDSDEYLTDKMRDLVDYSSEKITYSERVFKDTFNLLCETTGEESFKKYSKDKSKFEGKFLIGAFEAIAIGLGSNIAEWIENANGIQQASLLKQKIISLWENEAFKRSTGAGKNAQSRIPATISVGKDLMKY